MILVSGSAGKTGRAVIRALTARGESVRAWVHRPGQARSVKELGAREIVVGDLENRATVDLATRDIRAVYHICPNVSPQEVAIGKNMIAGAQAARVEHFCFHSVLHPQTQDMPHHWQKMLVEEHLFKSNLSFTIFQPTIYMQNLLAHWESIERRGMYPIPYPAKTRLSMVDLEDIAEVAATVLTRTGHCGATYELVGTEPISQLELVDQLGRALGHPVDVEVIPLDTWREKAQKQGLGDYRLNTLCSMFQYYTDFGLGGNPNTLKWLLGRPPTTLIGFIKKAKRRASEPAS